VILSRITEFSTIEDLQIFAFLLPLLANIAHLWARLAKLHGLHTERITERFYSNWMPKARKNHKRESHTSRKHAECWLKRLLAAEIKIEEERYRRENEERQRELGLVHNVVCEIYYSPYNSSTPEREYLRPEEPHPFSSRAASPINYNNEYPKGKI
jgi:hypothetical protein